MTTRRGSIVVHHDAATTWAACSDITRLPEFIAGIESCRELPSGGQEWTGRAFGIRRTWRSEWVDRTPPTHLAWRTDDSMVPDGELDVAELDAARTRVTITMHYHPATLRDRILVNRLATRARLWWDLRCFRRWLDERATDQRVAPTTGAVAGVLLNADSSALP